MPLYVYKCQECGHEFEEIVTYNDRDSEKPCTMCGKDSRRVEVTPFAFSVKTDKGATLVSPKEVDKAVGEDAEKRWSWLENRKNRRLEGWKKGGLKDMSLSKGRDGSFKPVSSLGDSKVRGLRQEYSEALAEHRAERSKKGEKQFDGPGTIQE